MISKLTDIDRDTVSATGMKFDLSKVIDTSLAILRTLVGRTAMRFSGYGPAQYGFVLNTFQEDRLPFDEESYRVINDTFAQVKRKAYDAAGFHCCVEFGPFSADLFLLGFEDLHGPIGNCVTSFDMNWDEFDPTPMMMLTLRDGLSDKIGGPFWTFLGETLQGYEGRGIAWEAYGSTVVSLALRVQFPFDTFGAGLGRIRICRELDETSGGGKDRAR